MASHVASHCSLFAKCALGLALRSTFLSMAQCAGSIYGVAGENSSEPLGLFPASTLVVVDLDKRAGEIELSSFSD